MPAQKFARGSVMVYGSQAVLKPLGAETVSTTGAAYDTGESKYVYVEVNVSAVGGTPTMTVVIEGSQDGINWFTLGTIGANGYAVGSVVSVPTNITGTGLSRALFPAPQFIRYRSVIGGAGPSLTYSINIEKD